MKAQEEIGRRKNKMKEHEASYKEQTDKLNEQTQKYTALDRQLKEKVKIWTQLVTFFGIYHMG